MTTASITLMVFKAPELVLTSMINGAKNSIELCLKLLAIYSVWLAIMNIIQQSNLDKKIAKLLLPITKRLFKGENQTALNNISLNFSANLLGIGSIATPFGIKAIENMSEKNQIYASDNIILFVVINCTSLQILPSTIIGLRASYQSASPADIILPTIIASTISTIVGIALCFLCKKFFKGKQKIWQII